MFRIAITICALALSPAASAVCTLARGAPTAVTIPSQVIRINADAPADTSTPIAQFDSNSAGQNIGYDNCVTGTEYGKRAQNLVGQDATTRIYQTNIPGIGIKLLWNNGSAFGNFPSTALLTFPNGAQSGTFDYVAASFFRIQFFKTANNLRLSDPNGDTVLPAGDIAYNYLMTADPASFIMKLAIGDIKIMSTPTCDVDSAKTIDFNEVTPSLLSEGVTRNLDFKITCKSDYGTYSAKASMTTNTPSSDGSYIRVQDAGGNLDRLGIKITDGAGKAMKLDGSTSEQKSSITSQGPAEFAWNATLFASGKTAPAGGTFNAKAEVVFDIQ
ncbi:fimbrial protein [Enterobacter cloacae subsp. cloacae]|uniref:fimbrial protein n=1 Tax=Enterobacter cloacae TaxID=550 RepID=UPI00063AAFEC|nr:fimbrial protein [Enterobacter cloacae]KLG05257.1 fimbrial protein [Enterobacter cloacae subsp. cloacae]